MKCKVREICGDWALDMQNFNDSVITIYFNSMQNALNVKRILEVDASIPNAATVCDMQEVVRCKDCRLAKESSEFDGWYFCKNNQMTHKPTHFCSYGERKDENV
jgi:hypothetical protein